MGMGRSLGRLCDWYTLLFLRVQFDLVMLNLLVGMVPPLRVKTKLSTIINDYSIEAMVLSPTLCRMDYFLIMLSGLEGEYQVLRKYLLNRSTDGLSV